MTRHPFGWDLPPGVTDRMIDEAANGGISSDERSLLEWLSEEEFSQYGECHGGTLDSLIAKGLVQVHGPGEHQSSFIAKGNTKMHAAVSLTEEGRKFLSPLDIQRRRR